jgi:hypothetical protein
MSEPPEAYAKDEYGNVYPLPTIPQAQIDAFYSAAGYAINQWAHLDRLLFKCFSICLGATERKAAVLYYRQKEFGGRLSLTDDLLKAVIDGDILIKWNTIKGNLNTRIRNILAHHPIQFRTEWTNVSHLTPESPIQTVGHKAFASFDENEILAGREKNQVEITYKDVVDYAQKIQKWETQLNEFKNTLEAHLESIQTSSQ